MAIRKITDQSLSAQIATLLGLIALVTSVFGTVGLIAADKVIDDKYATDIDVQSLQKEFASQVKRLTDTVHENTSVSRETSRSVQALALSIVTIQIRSLEPSVQELEREKSVQGSQWSTIKESTLRDLHRSLSDLEIQRRHLVEAVTGKKMPTY